MTTSPRERVTETDEWRKILRDFAWWGWFPWRRNPTNTKWSSHPWLNTVAIYPRRLRAVAPLLLSHSSNPLKLPASSLRCTLVLYFAFIFVQKVYLDPMLCSNCSQKMDIELVQTVNYRTVSRSCQQKKKGKEKKCKKKGKVVNIYNRCFCSFVVFLIHDTVRSNESWLTCFCRIVSSFYL